VRQAYPDPWLSLQLPHRPRATLILERLTSLMDGASLPLTGTTEYINPVIIGTRDDEAAAISELNLRCELSETGQA
jgi:hypothetical protein